MEMYSVQEESTMDVLNECLELARDHYYEVESKSKDIPYNIDRETAKVIIDLGLLTIITARKDGELVGYFGSIVSKDFFTSRVEARELGIYVKPECRKSSVFYRLMKKTEQVLADKGVKAIYIMFKEGHDVGLAGKLGYDKTETVYQKILET